MLLNPDFALRHTIHEQVFTIADVNKLIIWTDFLSYFNLLVSVGHKRLVDDNITVEMSISFLQTNSPQVTVFIELKRTGNPPTSLGASSGASHCNQRNTNKCKTFLRFMNEVTTKLDFCYAKCNTWLPSYNYYTNTESPLTSPKVLSDWHRLRYSDTSFARYGYTVSSTSFIRSTRAYTNTRHSFFTIWLFQLHLPRRHSYHSRILYN